MSKVLVLSADAGFGHRSASRAIVKAIEQRFGHVCEPLLVNPLDEPGVPAFVRGAQTDHSRMAREWPNLYAFTQRVTDTAIVGGVNSLANLFLYEAVSTVIGRIRPDIIVLTHPVYLPPVVNYFRLASHRVPLVTVTTDLARLHRAWFKKDVDLYLAPTEEAAALAVERGISPEKIALCGVPVDPELGRPARSRSEARQALGLQPDLFTVLAVGSRRVRDLERFVQTLNHSGFPIQLITVAGGDDEVYGRLEAGEWHVPCRVYNYVDNMRELMHAADCVLSKAGGLIVAESLAAGLPLLLIQSTPPHEKGNAEYVIANDAGAITTDPLALLQTICHWLADDRALFIRQAAAARRLGKPDAAYRAAELIWELLARRTTPNALTARTGD